MAILTGGLTMSVFAQEAKSISASDPVLPDAPAAASSSQQPSAAPADHGSAAILGTILDPNGDVISGAQVTLEEKSGAGRRVVQSGSNGEFAFPALAPGSYRLTVAAKGMGTYVSPEIVLHSGETDNLPEIKLAIAEANTEVQVTATQVEIAQEQINLQLEQRVLGVFPNFYTSYIWDAQPLSSKQKFKLALHSVTDPVAFAGYGFIAGIEQASDTFPGYGQGAEGYGKRYGAAFANDAIGRMLGSAIYPSLLHQDPRYFYKGTGTVRERTLYAIGQAFVCRGDNGKRQPNYSHIFGTFSAAGLSNLYHPASDRGASLTIFNGLIDTAGNAANNVVREFLFKRLTPKVPDYSEGKP